MCTDAKREVCKTKYKPTLSIYLSLNLSFYLSIYYRCVQMPKEKYVGQNINPPVLKVIMGSSVGWSRILLAKFFW